MADGTHISWTDATWNPIVGCSVLSPGCTNCYAMKMAWRLANNPATPHYAGTVEKHGGKPVWTGKVATAPDRVLMEPLHRRKPTMYFVNSMGDLFHENVPDEWIDRVFAVMALAPRHVFQVLTKRAERMREYCRSRNGMGNEQICRAINKIPAGMGNRHGALSMPLPNVWLGVSVEDQERADERIPLLLDTPAAVRWISAEPLLGPIDLTRIQFRNQKGGSEEWDALDLYMEFDDGTSNDECAATLDWVVAGGESGQNKPGRPMHPDWARSLRDQCVAAGVPYHFKQWGDWVPVIADQGDHGIVCVEDGCGDLEVFEDETRRPIVTIEGQEMWRVGARRAGRLLDGRTWDEMPGRQP